MTAAPFAFFEFAPAGGAGMTAACACTTPTGAKGEALTFTRTGAATCSKQGLATTGINDGDLVVCSNNNEPRVEPSGGVLGLRVERARTNSILRSQEFNNAAWALASGGAPNPGNPVVTANAAVAPDGTTTAERVDFASTTGTGFGVVYNTAGRVSTAASWSHSIYVKGVSGSGTIYLMSAGPGPVFNSTACAFVSTSWSRCSFTGTETAATWYTQIGFDLRDATQSGQGAQSVYLWGVQGEAGAYPTSYIPTVAASATRNAELATLPLAVTQQTQCQAATVELLGTSSNDRIWVMTRALSGSGDFIASYTQAAARVDTVGSGAVSVTGAGSAFGAVTRFLSTWNGSTLTMFRNATQTGTVTTANTLGAATIVGLGGSPAGASLLDGIVTRVQVDPSPSRCSP